MKKSKIAKRTLSNKKKRQHAPDQAGASFLQNVFQQAVSLHEAGRRSDAEALFKQILRIDPDHVMALHYLGILAFEEGRFEFASERMHQVVNLKPDFAEAHYNLGNALRTLNKLDEAAASYQRTLDLKPDYVEACYNLGGLLQRSGEPKQAEAYFRRVLELKPDWAAAHNNLGIVLQSQNELGEAEKCYRRALILNPDFAEALNNLGNVLHSLGKSGDAEDCYRQALSLNPNYVEARTNLGIELQDKGKLDEAVDNYRQALTLKPDYVDALNNLGTALQELGLPVEAMASFRRALSLKPDFAEAYHNLGNSLHAIGKLDEAAASYRQALSLKPDFAEAYYSLGNSLHAIGKLDEAAASYRQALKLKPDYFEAYRILSFIEKHNDYNFSIKRKEDLYASIDLSGKAKMHLGFALGKIFEDLKQYDKSFHFILEANQLQRQSYEYSIQDDQELFSKIENIFSEQFFLSRQGVGNPDTTPIFIIGMPRSGTTLVEQILASHPLVFGAGELPDLANLVASFCSGESAGQFPECVPRLSAAALKKMGSDYIVKIRRHSQEAKYITDKMPGNFRYVGLIKVALPNARIIHCRRDPMDNCLSIFKNWFSGEGGHKYAYQMDELGRYYLLYRGLVEHWERVLPGFIYPLCYEDLIFDQQEQTAKLLEFCSLPWDDACLNFHKTKREVHTASFAQVRQPMYTDSIKSWKRYENQLEPLRKALGEDCG